ncbi:MAG: hypothetical protein ACP5O7_09355, partial [Phycisphaerae bacterium]
CPVSFVVGSRRLIIQSRLDPPPRIRAFQTHRNPGHYLDRLLAIAQGLLLWRHGRRRLANRLTL